MLHSLCPEKHIQGNPLESHLRTFGASLLESGYRDTAIYGKLYLLSALGRWLGRSKRPVSQLDEHVTDTFAKYKRRLHRDELNLTTLQQFIDHLRKLNIIPHLKQAPDSSPLTEILNAYGQYLRSERGLIPGTIRDYQSYAQKFLIERYRGKPLVLKTLKASDISNFVLRHCRNISIKRAQVMTTAFRSFFRYLFQKGDIGTNLAASVPGVPDWRQATVPKYLTSKEVQRVLGACNRRTPKGRRDYAILLLLARLGLRAGEVVSLQLEDIDWRAGEILVRGKGLRHDRMPLPNDVGKALTSYLRRDRPACQTRRVFVCMNAPHRGLAPRATLSIIVRCALERANLHPPSKGAHLLRHSLATSMLRFGATMGEIGEVLRHRNLDTTDIYAKVDFDSLRSLAHPWPAGGKQ